MRVQVKSPPTNWNVNFFKKGQTFALLDPEWKFSYDFYLDLYIENPSKQVQFFVGDPTEQIVGILEKCDKTAA